MEQPFGDVDQAISLFDAGVLMCSHLKHKVFHFLRRKAQAVILHGDLNGISAYRGVNMDRLYLIAEAVNDGIFNDRLKQQLGDPELGNFRGHGDVQRDLIFKSAVLEVNVQGNMAYFIFEGDEILPLAEA